MAARRLLVTADDFGIGPDTSRGILELGTLGLVTSTVLLVNSPHAADGVQMWHAAGRPLELGWHPCLTLDRPLLPPERVPSLVDRHGQFLSLGSLLKRLLFGRIVRGELEAEFRAQYRRFVELVGSPPANVNGHHHVHIFRPIGDALMAVLSEQSPRPFLRRVLEPWRTIQRVRGVRVKRWGLSHFGGGAARRQMANGFLGNEVLLGVTDPRFVHDPDFFARWVRTSPGEVVELMCHPGHHDPTLNGRDGSEADGGLRRRVVEFEQMKNPAFRQAVTEAGFRLVSTSGVG